MRPPALCVADFFEEPLWRDAIFFEFERDGVCRGFLNVNTDQFDILQRLAFVCCLHGYELQGKQARDHFGGRIGGKCEQASFGIVLE